MANIQTATLNGSELKVEGLGGQNTAIFNKSDSAIYASAYPNIVPEDDGVIEVPAGVRDGLYGTNGTVYLLGTGKVELRGTDYSVNFKRPSSSKGGGGEMPIEGALSVYYDRGTYDENSGLWENGLDKTQHMDGSFTLTSDGFETTDALTFAAPIPKTVYIVFGFVRPPQNSILNYVFGELGASTKRENGAMIAYGHGSYRNEYCVFGGWLTPVAPTGIGYDLKTHVLCVARTDDNLINVFWDGKIAIGDGVGIRIGTTGYNGLCNVCGYDPSYKNKNDLEFKLIAVADTRHTNEQIIANSKRLMQKYGVGG